MKNSFLIFAVLLPLLSFGSMSARILYFPNVGSTNTAYRSFGSLSDDSALYNAYFNNTFGMLVNSSFNVISPSASSSSVWYSSILNKQINLDSSSGNHYTNSPAIFPRVYSLFQTASYFLANGYDGSGIQYISSIGSRSFYNVNFLTLVSDAYSSTNTIFRQILISHLTSLSSGLDFIRNDLSNLSLQYSAVNPLSSLSVSNAVQSAYDLSLIDYPLYEHWIDELDSASSLSPDSRALVNNSILRSLDSLSSVDGFIQGVNNSSIRNRDNLNSALSSLGDGLASGGSHHFTTPLTNELQRLNTNWVAQAKAALSNNTFQIKAALSNNSERIKQQLDSMFSNPADSSTVGGGIANISRAAGVLAGAVNNHRLTVTVENANPISVNLDGPINIDQSQLTELTIPLSGLQSRVDTWYQDWYSFYSPNVSGYTWLNFFDMVSSFKDANHSDLSALSNSFYSVGFSISNLLASIDNLLERELPNITNKVPLSASFSSLLHEDYSNFVEHSYSDILFNLENQYPDAYSDLVNLGLEEDSRYGRWWTLQSSSLAYISAACRSNNTIIASVIGDLLSVRSALESFSDGSSPLSLFSDVASAIPTQTKIEDFLNQATNAVNSIGSSGQSALSAFSSYSNTASRAFSIFNDSYSLPASITLLRLPNERYITVPVGKSPNIWRLMRWGISLGLVCVNIILFPKFFFFIVTLFMRLFRRSVKILPSER